MTFLMALELLQAWIIRTQRQKECSIDSREWEGKPEKGLQAAKWSHNEEKGFDDCPFCSLSLLRAEAAVLRS